MAHLVLPTVLDTGSREPINLMGWTIEGVSVGGQETSILLPSLKVAFDVGRCPQRSISQQHVFITHGHMDHVGGIPFHCATRALMGVPPTQMYGQQDVCKAALDILDVHSRIEGLPIPLDAHAFTIGDRVDLKGNYFVKPFPTVHVVPSQGYCVYQERKKLKREFASMPGQEIGKLRRDGVEVTDAIQTPEVAFTGDTTIEFVKDGRCQDALNARVLIMECTFLDERKDPADARDLGHVHLDDIVENADVFKNEVILLMHFSPRYKADEILDLLGRKLPSSLRGRVYPFLQGFSLR